MHITEPARQIPIIQTVDVCVLGGSCTGVFAAVRAARLGASVALIEKQNSFGGVATNGLVNIWHSDHDMDWDNQIIAGLSLEMVDRLDRRDAVTFKEGNADARFILNTEELKIELDQVVLEHDITPYLHTFATVPLMDGDRIDAIFIENKDGRGAIQAKVFIDATGDGDLAKHVGLPYRVDPHLQSPTTCAKIKGLDGINTRELYNKHREEFGLPKDAGWAGSIPGTDVRMHAETHIFGANTADAAQFTQAEIAGRATIRALMDMVRTYLPERKEQLCLLDMSASMGVRETQRFSAEYELTEHDVLHGIRFDDAIANGTYRVDIHYPSGGGYLFKYLDGRQVSITSDGKEHGRWRPETTTNPQFYQIPYRTMVHRQAPNLIMAGRMIAADAGAFGAIRVMITMNQTGEAAGVAAAMAVNDQCATNAVDITGLRQRLADGGSIML